MKKTTSIIFLVLLVIGISSCASRPSSSPATRASETISPTQTAAPSATPTTASVDLTSVTDKLDVELVKEIQPTTEWIKGMALSPDGSLIAFSYVNENAIHLMDAGSGSEVGVLEGHGAPVTSLAFSPDGSLLASATTSLDSADKSVRLWNVSKRTQLAIQENTGAYSLAFSPDGKLLAGNGSGVLVWSVPDLSLVHTIDKGSARMAFSPDSSLLAAAVNRDGLVHLLNVSSWLDTTMQVVNGSSIWALAFSPAGNLLASGNEDDTIAILNFTNGESVNVLSGHEGNIADLAFSPQGNLLASLGSGVKMSSSGNTFSANRVGQDRFIRFWNIKAGSQVGTVKVEGEIIAMGFSTDWSVIATGDSTGHIRIWKIKP